MNYFSLPVFRTSQMLFDEDFEFFLQEMRVQTFLNAHHSELHDFLGDHPLRGHALELGSDRDEDQVREAHAVEGRNESDGDPLPDFRGVIEHGHDVDEAQDRADDTDRGRITTHSLEDLACHFFVFECERDLRIDDLTNRVGLETVDHVFDRFFEHRVLDAFALTFNGQHALFTRDGGDLNDLVDVGPDIEIHLFEDGGKKFESAFDVVGRIRKQHRAGRAAKNDDSGRPLH